MSENGRRARRLPRIPAAGERIPLLIDTDAGCEIDDQFAIALAIHYEERFDIKGFVATHFHDDPSSMKRGPEEIARVLELSGVAGRWPIKRGGPPLGFSKVPTESEGADFIIETAMAHSPDDPLWIVVLGACTNTVSAWLKRPEIAERVNVLWHGRTQFWPQKCYNFNIFGDVKASRVLFESNVPVVLFDTGTYLRVLPEETEKHLAPRGRIGRDLHELRTRVKSPKKSIFDLGDIAFLIDPSVAYWEETGAPSVSWDLSYDWSRTYGKMLRVYQIDRDRTFQMLYNRLAERYPG